MSTDRTAEWLQNTRIHQESAEHALGVKDVDHWCLAAVVNVDMPRALAAVEAVMKLADEASELEVSGVRLDWWTLSPAQIREAITAALTGKEAGDG